MKNLKKDHEEVKKELKNLSKEFESLRAKMADKSDRASSPSSADVQHLSDTCDGFSTTIESFQRRLNKLASQVEAVTKAIDEATSYSYQYNLKIFGVQGWIQSSPSDFQKSLKCFKICVCYFSGSLLQFEKSIILLILLIIMKYTLKKTCCISLSR